MSVIGLTAAQINVRNRAFWIRQSQLMTKWLKDAAIRELACVLMESEQYRGVPVFYQMTFEFALEKAAVARRCFTAERARQAGSSKKADPLQNIIEQLVAENPTISAMQLRAKLSHDRYPDVIDDVEEGLIAFTTHNGRSKEASLSGLKDRLSRAKKKLRAR